MRMTRWLTALFFLVGATVVCAATTTGENIQIGSYIFGAVKARAIGPAVMGGRIAAIDVVNCDPRVIYVGAASGGLWKSTSGGTTFDPVFDKHTQSIGAIAIDQQSPDTVWVGTGEPWVRNSVSVGTGLYRTTDGGETWRLMGLENSERIGDIIIDPRNSEVVYVAVLGHLWNAHEDRGLFKTTNGGESWEKILYVDENTGCADIAIDPQEPDIIYAAMWEFRRKPYFFTSGGPGSGLFKSTDGGKNWNKLSRGLPHGELGRIALAVAPSQSNVVYAVVEAQETALYRSDDHGETWSKRNTSYNIGYRPFYFSLLLVDPQDPDRVYKPGLMLTFSTDGGKSFIAPIGGLMTVHVDHHALWINPDNPYHLLLGTDGGIYVSFDRGNSWRFLNNLPVSQFYHVSCDGNKPYNVYGGLQDNGSWFGPSRSPQGIENRDWQNIGGGDGFYVFLDPTDSNIIYYNAQGGIAFRHHRLTGENKDIKPYPVEGEPAFRFNWNAPMTLSPNNPNKLYIGAQFLFHSTDKGESWQRLSDDLTTNDPQKQKQCKSGGLTIDNTTAENHCTIYTIAESPLDADLLWVGTDDGNVQVTKDGGNSWSNVVGNIKELPRHTWCSCIEASHHHRETAYAAFDGHRSGDMRSYIYRTTDLGKNWEFLTTEVIRGYVHVIREDPVNSNLLFVGTEFGLFISIDGGKQWVQYTEGLPNVAVRDMVVHPTESDLILATHGRGIYIIDDITPLRQITAEVLSADVYFFESRPVIIKIPWWRQEFPGDGNFTGVNPSEVATIDYYLKKRHIFGDMKVEIFDSNGDLVTTLSGGKRKGINRVNWFMRRKAPNISSGPGLAYLPMFGPMVPEGTYTVKLSKGADTYTGEIQLIADPDSPHSSEDRALQQQTVMKLYRLQQRVVYITAVVADIEDQARTRVADLDEGEDLRKTLQGFIDKLEMFRKDLVVRKAKPGRQPPTIAAENR